jgi:VanZ family protein
MNRRRADADWSRAVGVTLVLLAASLVPSPFDRRPGWEPVGPDKFLHLVGHAGYAVVLADALDGWRGSRGEAAVLAVCLSTAHSLLASRLQRHVPGRRGELGDIVAGALGATLAATGWYVRGNGAGRSEDGESASPSP